MEIDSEGQSAFSLIRRYLRVYQQSREAAKSGQEFLRHLKNQRDGQRRIRELEELCKSAKGKRARELEDILRGERKELDGHWKEMRQKWPDFMRELEL